MMKEVFGFIAWQWRKWDLWQRMFIVFMTVFLVAVLLPEPYDVYAVSALMFVLLGWTFKWAVWDNLKANWAKYRAERNQLFKTIRDSDQPSQ